MAAQCCTMRFFTVECNVPLYDEIFLSQLSEYQHKSYVADRKDSLGYISVADSVALTSTNVT